MMLLHNSFRRASVVLLLVTLIVLSGCTMAPNYVRPEAPINPNWPDNYMPDGTILAQPATLSIADTGWRTFFTDPQLQRIIELALANNRDLRVSALNIEKARSMYQIQRADLLPSVNGVGESSNSGVPAGLSSTGERTVTRKSTVGLAISGYELDFFGRVQSLKDKALEEYLGTEEALKSAQISLVSEIASAYLAVVADRERLGIAEGTLKSQRATYNMIKKRFDVGVSSELDLWQAQTSVDTARVDIARYTSQVAQDMVALSLLAGTSVTPEMLPLQTLSQLPVWPDIPVTMPSQVLLQRPDILQSEHMLKAANANIGAARANFFPRITIGASLGSATDSISNLFDGATGAWSFLPQVTLPIFEGGRNVANLKVSETEKAIAVATYEKSIQTAFREVSDALILRLSLVRQMEAQQSLTHAASETYRLSEERYNRGVDSYLSVLDSQRFLYSSQLNLVTVRVGREANMIVLYKVLGGGWKE